MLKFLVTFHFLVFVFGYEKVICDSKIDLEIEDYGLYFIESPNFPHSMTEQMKENCVLNISAKQNYLYFVITNGFLTGMTINDEPGFFDTITPTDSPFVYEATIPSIIFKFINFSIPSWTAFQGYVFHSESNEDCLMSDQTNALNPFMFTDETQIIAINTPTNETCEWHFTGPEGYGFKIVVQMFNIDFMDLVAVNSTNYTVVGASNYNQSRPFASYNHDNRISVYLTQRYFDHDFNFFAYITLVKNEWKETADACSNEFGGDTRIWKILNYPFNIHCHLNVTVSPGTEIVATFSMFNLEENVDQLNVYYPDGRKVMITQDMENIAIFEPTNNETAAIYMGEFLSDGSVQSGGFSLVLETLKCICAPRNIIVPCNETKRYFIMDEETEYFCRNINCTFIFTINDACSTKHILFHSYETTHHRKFHYKIYSNNILYYNSRTLKHLVDENAEMQFVLDSTKETRMKFISKEPNTKPFFFWLSAIEEPKNENVHILTAKSPSMIYDFSKMTENSFVSFQLAPELMSDELEVYTTVVNIYSKHLECFILYKNSNKSQALTFFDKMLQMSITEGQFPDLYKPESNSLAVYRPIGCESNAGFAFIRARQQHATNCYFKSNVFSYFFYTVPYKLSAAAKETGNCEVTILTQHDDLNGAQVIRSIWTTATSINVTMHSNTNESNPILTFNRNTQSIYQNIILGAPIYTIKIPAKASIVLDYHKVDTNDTSTPFIFTSKIFQSFIDTPFFGVPNTEPFNLRLLGSYDIGNNAVQFVVASINLSPKSQLYLMDNRNQTKTLTVAGQKLTYVNTTVRIYYYELNIGYLGARILISNYSG